MTYRGLIFNITQHPYLSRPLGGHRIAYFLRQKGWDIEVIDWANWWQLEQLQSLIQFRNPKKLRFIGFSKLFNIWPSIMEQFAAWLKQQYPHITLISGSSVNPMFQSRHIDWYVQGFGEYAILELLKYCMANGPKPKFHLMGSRKVINAIEDYPAFPMPSLMVKYEDRDFIDSHEWLTIELSRGCKFKCAFCQFPVIGIRQDTSRTADDFREQLQDAYDRFGVTDYLIADETANDRLEKITKCADVVESLEFDPWFSAYIRADLIAADSRQREELARMHVRGHFYGIESMHTASARSIGKGMSWDRLSASILETKKMFLANNGQFRGHIGLIAGLPFDTRETLMSSITWLRDNWQGQSFGIHHLMLPKKNGADKLSDISQNLDQFGYEEMSDHEVEKMDLEFLHAVRKIQKKGAYYEIDSINWRNQHMNIFEAQRIVHDIYVQKQQQDFRPGSFMINYKLTKKLTISERLHLTFDEYDSLLDEDISGYITKKLQ